MTTRIKMRRDTATNWATVNPILALGEAGYDTTNNQLRVGDGINTWADLSPVTGGLTDGNVDVTPAAIGLISTLGVSDNSGYIYIASPTLAFGNIYFTGSFYDDSVSNDLGYDNDAFYVGKMTADGTVVALKAINIPDGYNNQSAYGDSMTVDPVTGNVTLYGEQYSPDFDYNWVATKHELDSTLGNVTTTRYPTLSLSQTYFQDAINTDNGPITLMTDYNVSINYANVQPLGGSTYNLLGLVIADTFGSNSVPVVNNGWYIGGYDAGSGVTIDGVNSFDIYNPISNMSGHDSSWTITNTPGSNVYVISSFSGGADYATGEVIVIGGDQLGGNVTVNDLTITVGNVDSGTILDYTISGTAQTGWVWLYESSGIDFSYPPNDVDQWNVYQDASTNTIVSTVNWTRTVGSANNDYFYTIAADAGGNVYLGGQSYARNGYEGTHYEAAVVKLNSDGTKAWAKFIDFNQYESVQGIAVDATGNVVATGETNYGALSVTKLNPADGTIYWRTTVGDEDPMGLNEATVPVFDTNGNIIVAASYGSIISDGNDLLIVSFDPATGAVNYQRDITAPDDQYFWWENSSRYATGDGEHLYITPFNSNHDTAQLIKLPLDGNYDGYLQPDWTAREATWYVYTETAPTAYDDLGRLQSTAVEVVTDTSAVGGVVDILPYFTLTDRNISATLGGVVKGVRELTFLDGTSMTTAPSSTDSDYAGTNYTPMHIRTWNSGAQFYWNGYDDVLWFDSINAPDSINGLIVTGAIIEYQLYDDWNYGMMVGTIHAATFYDLINDGEATHTEHISAHPYGNAMAWNKPWIIHQYQNWNRVQLWFRGVPGYSQNIKMQWTAKVFYGPENYC